MGLTKRNTRSVHRTVYAGITQTITLIKRDNDQREGVTKTYKLFRCYPASITKTGQQIQGDETSDRRRVWIIPRTELDRVGIAYLNATDIIIDKKNRWWQVEANTEIQVKLFENELRLSCLSVNPPGDGN